MFTLRLCENCPPNHWKKKKRFASCDDELIPMFLKKKRKREILGSGSCHEQRATRRISWVDPGVEAVS